MEVDYKNKNSTSLERSTALPTSFSLPLMREQLFENHIGHFEILLENTEFSVKEIICSVQPLRVYIEDKFIAALLDFAIENLPSNVVYVADTNERVELNAGDVLVPKIISEQILSFFSEPLRLNRLCIKPLSILLSVHTCIRFAFPIKSFQFFSQKTNVEVRSAKLMQCCYFSECISPWIIAHYILHSMNTRIFIQRQ